jgi:hypothetical protein
MRQVHGVEHCEYLLAALGPVKHRVLPQHFVDLLAHPVDWIEGRHGLLEHHRHARGTQLAKTLLARNEDVFTIYENPTVYGRQAAPR